MLPVKPGAVWYAPPSSGLIWLFAIENWKAGVNQRKQQIALFTNNTMRAVKENRGGIR